LRVCQQRLNNLVHTHLVDPEAKAADVFTAIAIATPLSSNGATIFSFSQRVCVQHAFRHAAAAASVTAAATAAVTAAATAVATAVATNAAAAATDAATNERRSSVYPLRDRLSEQRLVERHRRRFRRAMQAAAAAACTSTAVWARATIQRSAIGRRRHDRA
jgi:hypothetical protein